VGLLDFDAAEIRSCSSARTARPWEPAGRLREINDELQFTLGEGPCVRPGELNEADLLVGQTLTHIASIAILQGGPPTPATVMPQLRSALAGRVVIEQAKGFLRQTLDLSVEEAFHLLRTYARAHGEHLTDVARTLMTDRQSRPALVAELAELFAAPPR
jgi:ANTAR domain-containing protein